MAKVAQIKIESCIGNKDPWLEAWGIEDDTFSASDMSDFLDKNKDADTIEIEIRSDGGNVDIAFDIADQLMTSGKKIVTKGYRVNSAATIVFLSADKENRYISSNVQFIIHNPYITDLWGSFTADDLAKIEKDTREYEEKIIDFYTDRCDLDDNARGEIINLMKSDTNLSADEIISFGFASNTISAGNIKDNVTPKASIAYTNDMARIVKAHYNKNQKNSISMMNKEQISAMNKLSNNFEKFMKTIGIGKRGKVKNSTVKTDKDETLYFDGELSEGTKIYRDENITDAVENGDYMLDDGKTITVKDGAIESIVDAVEDNSATLEDGSTIIFFEGEFSEGVEVFSDEAMETPLEDGDYTLDDGTQFTVEGGLVISITAAATAKSLKAYKKKSEKLEKENKLMRRQLENLNKQFQAFKKTVPGGNNPGDLKNDLLATKKWEDMTPAERHRSMRNKLKESFNIQN